MRSSDSGSESVVLRPSVSGETRAVRIRREGLRTLAFISKFRDTDVQGYPWSFTNENKQRVNLTLSDLSSSSGLQSPVPEKQWLKINMRSTITIAHVEQHTNSVSFKTNSLFAVFSSVRNLLSELPLHEGMFVFWHTLLQNLPGRFL